MYLEELPEVLVPAQVLVLGVALRGQAGRDASST